MSSNFCCASYLSGWVRIPSGITGRDKTVQMACSYPDGIAQYWFLPDKINPVYMLLPPMPHSIKKWVVAETGNVEIQWKLSICNKIIITVVIWLLKNRLSSIYVIFFMLELSHKIHIQVWGIFQWIRGISQNKMKAGMDLVYIHVHSCIFIFIHLRRDAIFCLFKN